MKSYPKPKKRKKEDVDWTGFAFPKRNPIRLKGAAYKRLQKSVLVRDNFECQRQGCGLRTTNQPHHIIYRSHGGDDTMENMVTLCGPLENDCHGKVHRPGGQNGR